MTFGQQYTTVVFNVKTSNWMQPKIFRKIEPLNMLILKAWLKLIDLIHLCKRPSFLSLNLVCWLWAYFISYLIRLLFLKWTRCSTYFNRIFISDETLCHKILIVLSSSQYIYWSISKTILNLVLKDCLYQWKLYGTDGHVKPLNSYSINKKTFSIEKLINC